MRNGSGVRVTGPLAAYADGFWGYLAGQGYAPSSAQDQLRLMAHASRWLDGQGADASGLTTERIAAFLSVRRSSYVRLVSGRALAPMLGFLRGVGVTPPQPAPVTCRGPAAPAPPGTARRSPASTVPAVLQRAAARLTRRPTGPARPR
jgi:hypothetical protein